MLSTVDTGQDNEEAIGKDDIGYAVAMWKCLSSSSLQEYIDTKFEEFDTDKTDTLNQKQLKELLTDLNSDKKGSIPVSDNEVQWVIEAADVEGDGHLTREEARPAVALWYISVGPSDLKPNHGPKTLIPWVYSFGVGIASCWLVAATSVLWSEEKTIGWLECSAMGLVWKLFVIDPAKTLFCGTLLEPVFTLLFGDAATDAALNTVTDQVDGALEDAADLADELGGMAEATADGAEVVSDVVQDGGAWGQGAGDEGGGPGGVDQVRFSAAVLRTLLGLFLCCHPDSRSARMLLVQATMIANMAAFHKFGQDGGGLVVSGKLKNKLNRTRARRASVVKMEELKSEDKKVSANIVHGRARSNTIYVSDTSIPPPAAACGGSRMFLSAVCGCLTQAEKVRQKRLKRGLSKGAFAAKAEMDMMSLTKYLSQHQHDGSFRTVQRSKELVQGSKAEANEHHENIKMQHAKSRSQMQNRLQERKGKREIAEEADGSRAMDRFRASLVDGEGDAGGPNTAQAGDPNSGHQIMTLSGAARGVVAEEDAVASFLGGLGDDSGPVSNTRNLLLLMVTQINFSDGLLVFAVDAAV